MAFKSLTSLIRTPAVGAAIEKESERDSERQQQLADALHPLVTEADLDTRISEIAGKEVADNIDAAAHIEDDPKLYKLLWLARRHPIAAQSILKAKKDSS